MKKVLSLMVIATSLLVGTGALVLGAQIIFDPTRSAPLAGLALQAGAVALTVVARLAVAAVTPGWPVWLFKK